MRADFCWARAMIGQAVALPSSVMNSRRLHHEDLRTRVCLAGPKIAYSPEVAHAETIAAWAIAPAIAHWQAGR